MADRPIITTLPSGAKYDTTTLNANFNLIIQAFDTLLGRTGTSGTNNTMTGDIDMAGKTIRNFVFPGTIVGVNWRGAWLTATAYVINDLIQTTGNSYICTISHTSGVFATDLGMNKWQLFASKGASGAGSGDLVSTNNLSDVADASASRTHLGLAIGSNVQAYDAKLAAIVGLSWASGKLIGLTGTSAASILDLSADGTLANNSDTSVATQKATKTYVDTAIGTSGVGVAKALVNFDGTNSATLNKVFNVSSVTTNGTGDYTINFTTPFADANYVPMFSIRAASAGPLLNGHILSQTTTALRMSVVQSGVGLASPTQVNVVVFGNQ